MIARVRTLVDSDSKQSLQEEEEKPRVGLSLLLRQRIKKDGTNLLPIARVHNIRESIQLQGRIQDFRFSGVETKWRAKRHDFSHAHFFCA